MKQIGLLGGTFDPPHMGHFIIAEYVYREMELDEVWFLPSYKPPHKKDSDVDPLDRLAMVQQALEGHDYFKVCDVELKREGKSYTVDTMVELNEKYPSYDFHFIIGGDMVDYLPEWERIGQLSQLVTFIGVKRPGYKWDPVIPVKGVEVPSIDISSTMLRQRLADGKSIRYLTPDPVYLYIKEHHLYDTDT